jgi:exosome complex component RRP43
MGADAGAGGGDAASLQASAFKRLYPEQYFQRFLSEGLRPDGRTLSVCRAASIGLHSVAQADGSAMVKLGATTVLAGARRPLAAGWLAG